MPTVEIVKMGLGNLQDNPMAETGILFYLSPQYVAEEEEERQ